MILRVNGTRPTRTSEGFCHTQDTVESIRYKNGGDDGMQQKNKKDEPWKRASRREALTDGRGI